MITSVFRPSVIVLLCLLCPTLLAQTWEMEYVACPRQFDNLTDRTIRVDASGHRHVAFGGFNLHYMWEDGSPWHEDIADPTLHVGSYASLDLDSEGGPHVAYHDEQDGDLRYAWKGPAGWEVEVVDSVGWVGQWTSVAVDGSDVPHIAYYDTTGHNLRCATRTPLGWRIETVDSAGVVGEYASMALDEWGRAQIAYFARTEGSPSGLLRHAGWNGSQWVISTLDSACAGQVSIDLDGEAHAHVSYGAPVAGGGEHLAYASWDGAVWRIEHLARHVENQSSISVDAEGGVHIGFDWWIYYGSIWDSEWHIGYAYRGSQGWVFSDISSVCGPPGLGAPSLAVGADGVCRVSYIYRAAYMPNSWGLRCSSGMPDAWQDELIVPYRRFAHCSLKLDADGFPHVSYLELDDETELLYGHRVGPVWNTETVDGAALEDCSMALDYAGSPHVAYLDGATGFGLTYAYRDGTSWQVQTVDTQGGYSPSLALDSSGYAHLSYRSAYSDLKYAYADNTAWHFTIVDERGASGELTSIALDSSGYPHISYSGGGLKYAYEDAAGWHVEILDAGGDMGSHSSLALDSSGYPRVSYSTLWPSYDLKYAYEDAAGWHTQTVDSEGWVGGQSSLDLDNMGYPHISYYDATNGDLKHAYADPSVWHIQVVDSWGDAGNSSLFVDSLRRTHICYTSDGALKYARMVTPPVAAIPTLPLRIATLDVWPNPARGVVHAKLAMPEGRVMVRLTVVDLLGRRVMSLQQPEAMGAEATVTLRRPESVPTGQFFLGVEGDDARQFVPITVVK